MDMRICRLCLGKFPVYFSLLNAQISNMLESLTSIKIVENDELSTVACTKCLLNLKLAFNIQQNIIRIDEKLRDNYQNDIRIKGKIGDVTVESIGTIKPLKICDDLCKICGITIQQDANKHIQEHFQSTQECQNCNGNFKNIRDYRQHLTNCRQLKGGNTQCYICETCDIKFRYQSLYNLHVKNHGNTKNVDSYNDDDDDSSSDYKPDKRLKGKYFRMIVTDNNIYRCNVCSKVYNSRKQFNNHNSHTHERKECPICKASITTSHWTKHVKNHTTGKQICELCGATLRSLASLRGHMSYVHSQERYKCEECNLIFKLRYAYMIHCKSHTGEKGHICDQCGRGFVTKQYLNRHIRIKHMKLRPYICEFCKKGFSSRNALRTHRRQHTNETPYRCEVCGDGFRQNVSLRTHRKSKHNIIEPKTCACDVCGKKFGSRQAIFSHMRLH